MPRANENKGEWGGFLVQLQRTSRTAETTEGAGDNEPLKKNWQNSLNSKLRTQAQTRHMLPKRFQTPPESLTRLMVQVFPPIKQSV